MDFRMPSNLPYTALASRWRTLRGNLLDDLARVVRSQEQFDFGQALSQLETWRIFVDEGRLELHDAYTSFLDRAKTMVWCAGHVSKGRGAWLRDDELDGPVSDLSLVDAPSYVKANGGLARWVMRFFSSADANPDSYLAPARTLRVPIALAEQRMRDAGAIATLVLDVMSSQRSELAQHPVNALLTYAHCDFADSFGDAFNNALTYSRQLNPDEDLRYSVTWQVVDDNDQPIEQVTGRSASGAAARALVIAFAGQVFEEGVIPLMQIDKDGNFGEVDGVEAKTEAIAGARTPKGNGLRFSKILVAGGKNQREAEDELARLGLADEIEVVFVA